MTHALESIKATLDEMDGSATIRQLCDCTGIKVAEMHATLTELYVDHQIALFPHENGARPVDADTAACALRLGITDHIYVVRISGGI